MGLPEKWVLHFLTIYLILVSLYWWTSAESNRGPVYNNEVEIHKLECSKSTMLLST